MKFLPFLLTSIAGFSTIIGYFFIYIKSKNINNVLIFFLMFSSGVILTLSIGDLIPESLKLIFLNTNKNIFLTFIYFILFFIIGYYIIKIFKKFENNHSTHNLYRVGIITFFILFFHNVLEGIATYTSASFDISLGINLTIGIIMHNIPEGILIAVPIYYSTLNKLKALYLVLISGLSEPIGGILSYLIFKNIYSSLFISYLLIIIAGLMISLIINEILPEVSKIKNKIILKILSFTIGVVVIVLNLLIF